MEALIVFCYFYSFISSWFRFQFFGQDTSADERQNSNLSESMHFLVEVPSSKNPAEAAVSFEFLGGNFEDCDKKGLSPSTTTFSEPCSPAAWSSLVISVVCFFKRARPAGAPIFRNLLVRKLVFLGWILWGSQVEGSLEYLWLKFPDSLGTESKNQNVNLRWHLPWRGGSRGGLECHIPILKNNFFENHLESLPDCQNAFCT